MTDNRSLSHVLREVLVMCLPGILFGLFLFSQAGAQVVEQVTPAGLNRTYVWIFKKDGTEIGRHKVYVNAVCTAGLVKIVESKRTLINAADEWWYFWQAGPMSGWGPKGYRTEHRMHSEGFLISPEADDYHSIADCKVTCSAGVVCSHSKHVEN